MDQSFIDEVVKEARLDPSFKVIFSRSIGKGAPETQIVLEKKEPFGALERPAGLFIDL